MKLILSMLALGCGLFFQQANAALVSDCIGNNDFIYHEGNQLIPASTFLPAGTTAEFILKAPFDPKATYYVKFAAPYYDNGKVISGKDSITVAQMPENSGYVTSGLANKNDSLVRIQIPQLLATHWQTVKVRVYGCLNDSSPDINSAVDIKVSSTTWCAWIVITSAIILYLGATAAIRALRLRNLRAADRVAADKTGLETQAGYTFWRSLDPVVLTAGADGAGSLAKLQILFFSIIVSGLLFYILLRTGELSDLSETILLLLGIAAVGSTAGKGADLQKSRLDFDNYAWLIKRGWLTQNGFTGLSKARWADIVTSDGEFDVYRYQSCIFSLIVGGALIVVGVNQLASFQIPTTLLGVLGLSQIVYVTGKLVSPPAFSDLNNALSALIGKENDLRAARAKLGPTAAFTSAAIHAEYEQYVSAAKTTAIMFASATGLTRPSDDKLVPSEEV